MQTKITEYREKDTRDSKKEANRLRNRAFTAHVHQECISLQLAMTFLSHPPAATLLESQAKCKASPEYDREQKRLCKVIAEDQKIVQEKEHQVQLKTEVHHLRHLVRQMQARQQKKKHSDHDTEAKSKLPKVEFRRNATQAR